MRVNLPRYNCVLFEIESVFTISSELDPYVINLMEETYVLKVDNEDDVEHHSAIFASRAKIDGVFHRVGAHLARMKAGSEVNISLMVRSTVVSEDEPTPPRELAPVNLLVDAAKMFGEIPLSCRGVYQYNRQDGIESSIPFPYPLILPGDYFGVTHIENAEFSRRGEDGVEFSIQVNVPEFSDLFWHTVHNSHTLELSVYTFRSMVEQGRWISGPLLRRVDLE